MKDLLQKYPRLSDFYSIGPVQRAELESFLEEALIGDFVGVTADGKTVKELEKVWILDSSNMIPVSVSFSSEASALQYIKDNL